VATLGSNPVAHAQGTQSYEFWPEINLIYRLDDRTKLIGLADTARNRDSGTSYQAEVGGAVDHRFTDVISGRIGYRHAWATDGGSFREDRLLTEQTFRVPLPSKVMVDFRTREDFRWLDTGFSFRARERIQVQRDTTICSYTFTPYTSTEIYFDSRYGAFARYRLIAGINLPIGGPFSIEPYLARQVDFATTGNATNAIGLILAATF
jgi:hypothetical protein